MAKYFADVSGKLVETQPITTSVGAGDAAKIVQTDASGRLDISVMPAGVGAEVSVLPTSESLVAGNFVNIYNSAGVATARKADATTNAKPAQGFTLAAVTSPSNATVYGISTKNTALTGLTPGNDYWLSTTPGGVAIAAPQAAGNFVQELGTSESASAMVLSNVKFGWTKI